MSIRHMAAIWEDPYYSRADKTKLLVALSIADNARGEDGKAWPSIEYIARKARSSVRGAQEAIRQLERDWKLEVHPFKGVNGTNLYVVHLPPATVAPPRNEAAVKPPVKAAVRCTQIIRNQEESLGTLSMRKNRVSKIRDANPSIPSPSETEEYGATLDLDPAESKRFYDYYQARGWEIKGTLIRDWRAIMRTWQTSKEMGVKPAAVNSGPAKCIL